jgi:hypothetical protein
MSDTNHNGPIARGVCRKRDKWQAQVMLFNERIYLGLFADKIAALVSVLRYRASACDAAASRCRRMASRLEDLNHNG